MMTETVEVKGWIMQIMCQWIPDWRGWWQWKCTQPVLNLFVVWHRQFILANRKYTNRRS